MERGNDTRTSEFLLLGFSEGPELQPLVFELFLSMYLITVFGNLLILLAVSSDSRLHTPMYFFLANLSFVDICITSTTVPKMLWNIQTQSKVITYEDCITQVNFFIIFSGLDICLLAIMAYDRFVAICHPLHYTVIMNPRLCALLVLMSWITSVLHSLLQTSMVLRLSFCTGLEIPHFFCELNQMIQLACSDTFLNNVVMYLAAVLLAGGPLVGILYSYSKIVSSIRGISSAQGKYKAFSTCASHLLVVSLFYCTGLGVYLSSASTQSSDSSATASVMYTVVTPMLNPFIYSLRNRDIKRALKGRLGPKASTPPGSLLEKQGPRGPWRPEESEFAFQLQSLVNCVHSGETSVWNRFPHLLAIDPWSWVTIFVECCPAADDIQKHLFRHGQKSQEQLWREPLPRVSEPENPDIIPIKTTC
ncbi:olfactory receptor 7A17-like [Prionailurus bengalensis]|uniref:olfactory receptor 7A17-like n=1 Tax=Prionailurus bengalensis TaxID=37029 RepID=UPI001CAA1371|nr:olfactory receptor 7A17-like [Prionailurus bengalensis]